MEPFKKKRRKRKRRRKFELYFEDIVTNAHITKETVQSVWYTFYFDKENHGIPTNRFTLERY